MIEENDANLKERSGKLRRPAIFLNIHYADLCKGESTGRTKDRVG